MKPEKRWVKAARWGAIGVLLLLGASCDTCDQNPARSATNVGWTMTPITATFDPSCYCTKYSVTVTTNPALIISYNSSWKISLQLVDPAGSPDLSDPGSSAAVDLGCTNNGSGTPTPQNLSFLAGGNNSGTNTFTWYHPDAASAPPGIAAGTYNCDHTKQGPSGHQGVVTVTVSAALVQDESESKIGTVTPSSCTATIGGTISHTGTAPVCK
jgi:hypothetical protein